LNDTLYRNSGGFIPQNNQIDSEGFRVTCNCRRLSIICPRACCGLGRCDFAAGACDCSGVPGVVDPLTCCQDNTTSAPCFNDGNYCSGHGTCTNGACVCVTDSQNRPLWSGPACNISTPPTLTCEELTGVADCAGCNAAAQARGIFCSWCTPRLLTDNTSLTFGTCVRDVDCTTNLNPSCLILVQYVPEPCPDACSGHGSCQNTTQGNRTVGVCVCVEGWQGVNCGEGTEVVALAAGLGAAAIAGIVIAIVVVLAALGGGGYAIANNMAAAPIAPAVNNPLYVPGGRSGQNPLAKM
jgi:hypothetical protein